MQRELSHLKSSLIMSYHCKLNVMSYELLPLLADIINYCNVSSRTLLSFKVQFVPNRLANKIIANRSDKIYQANHLNTMYAILKRDQREAYVCRCYINSSSFYRYLLRFFGPLLLNILALSRSTIVYFEMKLSCLFELNGFSSVIIICTTS